MVHLSTGSFVQGQAGHDQQTGPHAGAERVHQGVDYRQRGGGHAVGADVHHAGQTRGTEGRRRTEDPRAQ